MWKSCPPLKKQLKFIYPQIKSPKLIKWCSYLRFEIQASPFKVKDLQRGRGNGVWQLIRHIYVFVLISEFFLERLRKFMYYTQNTESNQKWLWFVLLQHDLVQVLFEKEDSPGSPAHTYFIYSNPGNCTIRNLNIRDFWWQMSDHFCPTMRSRRINIVHLGSVSLVWAPMWWRLMRAGSKPNNSRVALEIWTYTRSPSHFFYYLLLFSIYFIFCYLITSLSVIRFLLFVFLFFLAPWWHTTKH